MMMKLLFPRMHSLVFVASAVSAFVGLALLTGCGSTTKVEQQQSVGSQLLDLEKSYKDGVINQKEYERLKKAIIRNND